MALPKIEELRELGDEEISDQILAMKKELFELRMQQATRQLEKPHLIRHAKHKLAQLMLLEGERKTGSKEK
ncbi:MAG: 50S ribosomal protein L29 [Anaerolineae bacterium]|jgi:large subunit ribosomal protein L29|nr:50S ribosomal protein L29 [Gloeobacterales cyanobacterium ES-bin-313]